MSCDARIGLLRKAPIELLLTRMGRITRIGADQRRPTGTRSAVAFSCACLLWTVERIYSSHITNIHYSRKESA